MRTKWNEYLHSCVARPQSWGRKQSRLVFFETDTFELEGTYSTRAALPTMNQSWRKVLWAGGLSLKACFFSGVNPQTPSSRQRAIDWTGLDDEPKNGVVQAHTVIAQTAIVFITSFTTSCLLASALSQAKFCSKGTPSLPSPPHP